MTTIAAVPPPAEVEEGAPGSRPLTFDDLLTRYQTELYRFATCLTCDRTAADDLYQQTLRTAYRAFDRLDGATNHRVWLFAIATNAFLRDPACARCEASLDEERVATNAPCSSWHAACADSRDLQCAVAAFVAALPCQQRAALVLRLNHHLGYAEIAATLRCSADGARATVYEVLRSLRAHVGDRL